MNRDTLKKALPTLMGHLERRRKVAQNQLPKHLRPLPRWPIVIQLALNSGIFITLSWLMLNRDEFLTEATPALGLVVCLLLLIYTLISAMRLKQRYKHLPGRRLAALNVWLMGLAALMIPLSVAYFLP
ncbi:MAG: hypothetical protein A2992_08955 [Elusimicrobia bacterium RIFCSPLOWO2_01_FULL_59_12]|nr:MAG: hypothetical protein A2992_08955 [Elusimicrobia bacterium RIFCSPLOWO2_01_FULL_59_12]